MSLDRAWRYVIHKTDQNLARLASAYPTITVGGVWQLSDRDDWIEGYWPGILWLAYEDSRDERYLSGARRLSSQLAPRALDVNTPPLSMVFYPSAVYAYRLTGDPAYRELALAAARSMAPRYSRRAGFVELTWRPPAEALLAGRTIVDTLLNLSLLWWASEQTGDPTFAEIATQSCLAALRSHVRSDYSTKHVVYADPDTGEVIRTEAGQGYSTESCWSRGQAWAIYGFSLAYRDARDPTFLEAAERLADYYLDHLPGDLVPYWDFHAPSIPNEPKDSSAAAIAACGLLDLAGQTTDLARSRRFAEAGRVTIVGLAEGYSSEGAEGQEGILLHGVYNRPRDFGVDCSLIWGDFYYAKALAKARRLGLR